MIKNVADELRILAARAESERTLLDRQRKLLEEIADAVKGVPPDGTVHGLYDLPEKVRCLVLENRLLLKQLQGVYGPND